VRIALVALVLLLGVAPTASASDRDTLHGYAERTWDSFEAMTDPSSGLPADVLESDGAKSVQTSTTNIGAYTWSAVAAERLGIVTHRELVGRFSRTVGTLEHMERYADTGQFYNWYLSLDQGMIMASLGNALGGDVLRRGFADRGLERALRPVIGIERFNLPGG